MCWKSVKIKLLEAFVAGNLDLFVRSENVTFGAASIFARVLTNGANVHCDAFTGLWSGKSHSTRKIICSPDLHKLAFPNDKSKSVQFVSTDEVFLNIFNFFQAQGTRVILPNQPLVWGSFLNTSNWWWIEYFDIVGVVQVTFNTFALRESFRAKCANKARSVKAFFVYTEHLSIWKANFTLVALKIFTCKEICGNGFFCLRVNPRKFWSGIELIVQMVFKWKEVAKNLTALWVNGANEATTLEVLLHQRFTGK
jgi:hypothetical protein